MANNFVATVIYIECHLTSTFPPAHRFVPVATGCRFPPGVLSFGKRRGERKVEKRQSVGLTTLLLLYILLFVLHFNLN